MHIYISYIYIYIYIYIYDNQSIGVIFVIMHDEVTDALNVQQLGWLLLRYTK